MAVETLCVQQQGKARGFAAGPHQRQAFEIFNLWE
jgi:hypothetical protein